MSEAVLSPRESGKLITENAKHVKLHDAGVKCLAKEVVEKLKNGSLSLDGFSQCAVHPQAADSHAIDWIFVVDTLNFCFWTPLGSPKWEVSWKGNKYTGYFALCAAINRAEDEGFSITNPKYYSQITMKDLTHILRGDDPSVIVPLLKERLECLHQVGLTLLERYDGKFSNCVKEASNSAKQLLKIVVSNFECFKDEAVYLDKRVALYKRAQILVGDIWVCFKGKETGSFQDIEEMTMFADYRVPQVLVHFKAMEYEPELSEKLKKDTVLANGSQEEVEIRGCSIEVVERIVKEVRKLLPVEDEDLSCNSIMVDHFLWDYRRQYAAELDYIPFHKTLSIYY